MTCVALAGDVSRYLVAAVANMRSRERERDRPLGVRDAVARGELRWPGELARARRWAEAIVDADGLAAFARRGGDLYAVRPSKPTFQGGVPRIYASALSLSDCRASG